MKSNQSHVAHHPGQHFQLLDEVVHDPYVDRKKLAEPSVCGDCGAIYHKGSWKWGAPPENAHAAICPACKRIREKFPAGYVSIQGTFAREHADEILNLVENFADRQKAEHPLKRIISISNDENGDPVIATTDIHLARGIGEALHKAHKGTLDYQYNPAEYLLRVRWER